MRRVGDGRRLARLAGVWVALSVTTGGTISDNRVAQVFCKEISIYDRMTLHSDVSCDFGQGARGMPSSALRSHAMPCIIAYRGAPPRIERHYICIASCDWLLWDADRWSLRCTSSALRHVSPDV
jgi:hypothetical protein